MASAARESREFAAALVRAAELARAGTGPGHLWLAVLETSYGEGLLAALRLSWDQVAAALVEEEGGCGLTEPAREVLAEAHRLTSLTQPPWDELGLGPEEPAPVDLCHLALALARTSEVRGLMQALGVVPSRLRWLVLGSDPRFPHPREAGADSRMSWAAAASEEARRLGWTEVGPEALLLGLLADPTNSACRALRGGGLDLNELRQRLEVPGEGARLADMEFSPEILEVFKRSVEVWGDLDPDSACTLQALLAVSQVLGPDQAAVEAALPRVLHGSLQRDQGVTIAGVAIGMSGEQVVQTLGEPSQRTREDGQESWSYGELGVLLKEDRVVGVHGSVLEQQGRPVLRRGDPWLRAEEVLGVRRQVALRGDPPVKIWTLVNGGRVGFLMLECLSHT